MGDDVKIFRSGDNALTVDAAVGIEGEVDVESVLIGGVPLDEYIQKIVDALRKEKRAWSSYETNSLEGFLSQIGGRSWQLLGSSSTFWIRVWKVQFYKLGTTFKS